MKGGAQIKVTDCALWVRFSGVGHGQRFHFVLQAFRDRFPDATWDEDRRAWALPTSQLRKVCRFCRTLFPSGNISVREDHTTKAQPWQMTLL